MVPRPGERMTTALPKAFSSKGPREHGSGCCLLFPRIHHAYKRFKRQGVVRGLEDLHRGQVLEPPHDLWAWIW